MTQSSDKNELKDLESKKIEIKSSRSMPVEQSRTVNGSQPRKISEDESKLDSSRIWIKRKPYRMYMFTSPQTTNYNNLYFDKKLCQIQISTCFLHVIQSYPHMYRYMWLNKNRFCRIFDLFKILLMDFYMILPLTSSRFWKKVCHQNCIKFTASEQKLCSMCVFVANTISTSVINDSFTNIRCKSSWS